MSLNTQPTWADLSACSNKKAGDSAKRATDLVLASAGFVLASPVLLGLAVCIKLDSKGPVFYRGKRAGRFGQPFLVWKLRSMVQNAERLGGAESPADDPRITRMGSFLRRYKLDELPQLLNVICGEMSLVGPRPEVLDEVCRYTPREKQLLLVRPGITDWASIKFRNEDEILRGSPDPHRDYHEKIRPDKVRLGLEYVEKRSLLVDFKILLQTLRSVVFDVA